MHVFLSFRIFEQLALALKNRVALKIFTGLKYFLSFRNFEQLALALKTEYVLKPFKPGAAASPCLVRLWYRAGVSKLSCPRATQVITQQFEGRTSYIT